MGGTWVHHSQAFTFRELLRYNLNQDLVGTAQRGHENDYSTFNIAGIFLPMTSPQSSSSSIEITELITIQ